MTVTQTIKVDLLRQTVPPVIQAKQGDSNSRFLCIEVTENGNPVRVDSSQIVHLHALRADNQNNTFLGSVNANGTVTVPLDAWILSVSGNAKCSVSFAGSTNQILQSMSFNLVVFPSEYNSSAFVVFFARTEYLPAGTYYISIEDTPYCFTTTQPVPIGGAIAFDLSMTVAATYTDKTLLRAIETDLPITNTESGTELTDDETVGAFLEIVQYVSEVSQQVRQMASDVAGFQDDIDDLESGLDDEKEVRRISDAELNTKIGRKTSVTVGGQTVATFDADTKADLVGGKVPAEQLPSYVDDVLEYASVSAFPAEGEAGKIYVALDTNKTYRWSGSTYTEISESLALGETAGTAYEGSKGKANADAISALQTAIGNVYTKTESDAAFAPKTATETAIAVRYTKAETDSAINGATTAISNAFIDALFA